MIPKTQLVADEVDAARLLDGYPSAEDRPRARNFLRQVDQTTYPHARTRWPEPPGFVYGIIVSLFLFFNVFAVNQYLQYKQVGRWADYLAGDAPTSP